MSKAESIVRARSIHSVLGDASRAARRTRPRVKYLTLCRTGLPDVLVRRNTTRSVSPLDAAPALLLPWAQALDLLLRT